MPKIKLTSINTPLVGLSWTVDKSECEVARDLLTFLEDRRVLRDRLGHAGALIASDPHSRAIKSVRAIRQRLRDDLEKVKPDSLVGRSMRAMQQACRDFLTAAELANEGETYERDLKTLRHAFAEHSLRIAEKLGYALQSEQAWGDDEQSYRDAYRECFFLNDAVRLVEGEQSTHEADGRKT
jgi:hypothetical protein